MRRPPGRRRRRRAHAPRGSGTRRIRDALARPAPPHRPEPPDGRQERDGLRPDRADARSDGCAPRGRPADRVRGRERGGARLRRSPAARHLRQGRRAPRDRVRLHRRVRRLPRRLPRQRAAERDHRVRKDLPVRLARPPLRHAARVARAHLRQQPARLRALLDAQPDAQPLLPAGAADHEGRGLVRPGLLGRAAPAAGRQGPRRARHRPLAREEHRAAAQLRRRAAALRPPVPGRRRGTHRAAHGRQGPEPRRDRREAPGGRAHRALPGRQRRRPRRLFGALPAPRLEGRAVFLVVHVPHAPLPRRRPDRRQAPGRGARLPVPLGARRAQPWPRTTSACRWTSASKRHERRNESDQERDVAAVCPRPAQRGEGKGEGSALCGDAGPSPAGLRPATSPRLRGAR